MQNSGASIEVFIILVGLMGAVLLILWAFGVLRDNKLIHRVTQKHRGTRSERDLVLRLIKSGVHPKTLFHDLYVEYKKGQYAQLDVVMVTRVGIIVFEVKDHSGWIFGDGRTTYWTQVLAYGKEKYRFYNPVKQNAGHLRHLKGKLKQFEYIPFFSVVVFTGDCTLKELHHVPDNHDVVKANGVKAVVEQILANNPPAPYTDKRAIVRVLQRAVENGANPNPQQQHIQRIREVVWSTG